MQVTAGEAGIGIDGERLSRLEEAIFRGEGRTLRLSLYVTGDEEIRDLNRSHLGHDYETDVIAFDLGGDGPPSGCPDDVDGELVVNAEMAAREGLARGHGAEAELLLYVAHGILHLLGYDDRDPRDRDRMMDRQRRYLGEVGVDLSS